MKATTINFKDIKDNNFILSPKHYLKRKEYADRAIEISDKIADLSAELDLTDPKHLTAIKLIMEIRNLVQKQDRFVLNDKDK